MHIIEHREMKSYFKRMLRILLSFEPNEENFLLKLYDREMGCEWKCKNVEKNKGKEEVLPWSIRGGNS